VRCRCAGKRGRRGARNAPAGGWLAPLVTVAIMAPFFWWTMDFLLAGRVPWSKLLPSAIVTGIFYGGLGVFSRFYFSGTIISDSKTYGTIGAILGIMTWLIAIGAVIILGAVAGDFGPVPVRVIPAPRTDDLPGPLGGSVPDTPPVPAGQRAQPQADDGGPVVVAGYP
jgi:Virulence factor BrkB